MVENNIFSSAVNCSRFRKSSAVNCRGEISSFTCVSHPSQMCEHQFSLELASFTTCSVKNNRVNMSLPPVI